MWDAVTVCWISLPFWRWRCSNQERECSVWRLSLQTWMMEICDCNIISDLINFQEREQRRLFLQFSWRKWCFSRIYFQMKSCVPWETITENCATRLRKFRCCLSPQWFKSDPCLKCFCNGPRFCGDEESTVQEIERLLKIIPFQLNLMLVFSSFYMLWRVSWLMEADLQAKMP